MKIPEFTHFEDVDLDNLTDPAAVHQLVSAFGPLDKLLNSHLLLNVLDVYIHSRKVRKLSPFEAYAGVMLEYAKVMNTPPTSSIP